MKQFAKLAGALAMWGLSSVASAITIGLDGDPVPFTMSETSGGYLVTASGSIDITALSATSLTLHVVLNNASTLSNGNPIANPGDVRLASWGFGIGPNATAVSFVDDADGGMISATLASIPSLGQIEVCVWGGNNCNGGGNQGLFAGASDTFDLTLDGQWDSLVTFDPLGVKFQGRVGGQFSCANSDCTPATGDLGIGSSVNGEGNAPEPHSLALVALGLLSFAILRRRQVA
jgi:hypothetical protein